MKAKEFREILQMFEDNGSFVYDGKNLQLACSAPMDKAGVYIFYSVSNGIKEIIYIGCCGHIENDGNLSIRETGKGGIYGRIVHGHQFGKVKRYKSLPLQMKTDNIDKMEIEWYVTHKGRLIKSPCFIESWLLQTYFEKYGKLPKWNKKF